MSEVKKEPSPIITLRLGGEEFKATVKEWEIKDE